MRYARRIAHRGWSSRFPENTLPAFSALRTLSVDGVEFDVQLTRDGQLVVIHDWILDRTTTGSGLVKDYTLAELKTFDAGAWMAPKFKGTQIPTLAEVLAVLGQDHRAFEYHVELKADARPGQGFESSILQQLWTAGVIERSLVSSFHEEALVEIRRLDPYIRIGVLCTGVSDRVLHIASALRAGSIHVQADHCRAEAVRAVHQAGHQIYAYTVNEAKEYRHLSQIGVDAVFTDNPPGLTGL